MSRTSASSHANTFIGNLILSNGSPVAFVLFSSSFLSSLVVLLIFFNAACIFYLLPANIKICPHSLNWHENMCWRHLWMDFCRASHKEPLYLQNDDRKFEKKTHKRGCYCKNSIANASLGHALPQNQMLANQQASSRCSRSPETHSASAKLCWKKDGEGTKEELHQVRFRGWGWKRGRRRSCNRFRRPRAFFSLFFSLNSCL